MKLLLLAGLLAVAFCHFDLSNGPAGKEVIYRLESQISSGMPGSSDSHAIVRMSARARFAFKTKNEVILRLSDFKTGELNDEVEKVDTLVSMQNVAETPIDAQLLEALERPVSFIFVNGLASSVVFDENDTEWTINYKRAVISMIQMNAQKTRSDRMAPEVSRSQEKSAEITVEGQCDVFYSAVKEMKKTQSSSDNDEKRWTMTKTIDFAACERHSIINYDYVQAEVCKECWHLRGDEPKDHHVKNLHRSTMINYIWSQEQLEKVSLLSVYVLPNAVRVADSDLVSTVVYEMTYEKTQDMSHDMEQGPRGGALSDVMYSSQQDQLIEKFEMYGDNALESEKSPFAVYPQKMNKIKELMKKVSTSAAVKENGIHWQHNEEYLHLVELYRTLSVAQLNEQFPTCFHMIKEAPLCKDLLANLLASAGTYNTINVLVEKTVSGHIHRTTAAQVVKTLNIKKPSTAHVDELVRLCEKSAMKDNEFARQSCWLSVGATINKWAKTNEMTKNMENTAQNYIQTLLKQFTSANNMMEKIVALKSVANAGLDVSVDDIQKIVMNKKEEKLVRIQAIDALRQLRATVPHKIHSMLLPVFQDAQEFPEVRMTAFSMMMHTMPEQMILDQIVKALKTERNSHVASFVVSMISSFAKSTNPCEKKLATDLKDVMNVAHLNNDLRDKTDSYYHIPMYSPSMDAGWFLNFASVYSNDSPIVKEAMAGLDTLFQGEWQKNLFQVGFAQENFEKVMEAGLDYINQKLRSVNWDQPIAVRGDRNNMKSPREMLKSIMTNLEIESRDNKLKSMAMIYIRWKNLDHAVFNFDLDFVDSAMKSVDTVLNSKIMPTIATRLLKEYGRWNYNMASIVYEAHTKIPTSIGMPLVTKNVVPFILHIDGDAQINFQKKFNLKMQFNIATTANHILKSEIWSPFSATGVKTMHAVELSMPANMTVIYGKAHDNVKNMIKLIYDVPKKQQHIAGLHTVPMTYFITEKADYAIPESFTTIHNRHIAHTEHKINREYMAHTGLPVKVTGYGYDLISLNKPLEVLFTGRNRFDISMVPHRDSPMVLEAVFEYQSTTKPPTSQKPDFEDFYNRDNKHIFKMDDLSEDQEFDRINEFDQDVRDFSAEQNVHSQFNIKLGALGGTVERKAQMITDTYCDETNHHCHHVALFYRTAVPEWKEEDDWNARVVFNFMYPKSLEELSRLAEKKHREMTASLSLDWGIKNSKSNNVNMKFQGEQTQSMREMIRSQLQSETKMTAMQRHELLEKANTMNQLKIDMKHSLSSEKVKDWAYAATMYLEYYNYFRTDVEKTWEKMPKDQILSTISFDNADQRYMNVTAENWQKTWKMHEYEMPMTLPQLFNYLRRLSTISSEQDDITWIPCFDGSTCASGVCDTAAYLGRAHCRFSACIDGVGCTADWQCGSIIGACSRPVICLGASCCNGFPLIRHHLKPGSLITDNTGVEHATLCTHPGDPTCQGAMCFRGYCT